MAGGRFQYRHLGRHSAHRQALLRNLVTSLFEHESISTSYPKAKEAQRLAEKLITMGKKNTEASRRNALAIFYKPHEMLTKLFGPLRERYADRPGGYTRVLLIEPLKEDQAPSAILELVDGPKDMRFAMTARTVAKLQREKKDLNEMTQRNVEKVTQFRKNGKAQLKWMVDKFKEGELADDREKMEEAREKPIVRKAVYPQTFDKLREQEQKKLKKKPGFFLA